VQRHALFQRAVGYVSGREKRIVWEIEAVLVGIVGWLYHIEKWNESMRRVVKFDGIMTGMMRFYRR
jgi:hypothetical protein